ncbi:hypothetical protein PYW07_011906 [Mythimna separata]|uniref:Chitin-binding type-2 domain-containing protein n=1 Tax=Mythimna separata TaxID=271217 RepID=A0AAD7Y774_MYTSE|nr:hypothetical protein PYW07_011906 [Mythimna separata]
MYKTLLFLTALALVQARPNEDAVVSNARVLQVLEEARNSNADDCETLDNGCPVDYTIHKIIPHERDCQLFYLCDKGERVVMPCPHPLYFDAETLRCVWETNCVNSPAPDIDDIIANDPDDTTPAAEVEDTTANGLLDIGEVLENGCPADFHIHHLLPHEECEKFYMCNFGEKVERDCAPGTVFHFEIQVCDWPRNVPRCAGSAGATARPSTPGSEDTTSGPIDWEALPNGCPADPSINHLLPHESVCEKYYACSSGSLIEMDCPTATHFSPSQQKCTWPHEAGCEHWKPCSNPDTGSCGEGSTATPINSTTPEEPTTTTELPSTEDSIIDLSTTPAESTDGNGEVTEPGSPGNETTTEVVDVSTTPEETGTEYPEHISTTPEETGTEYPEDISTTPEETGTEYPEDISTTAVPNNPTTPEEIETEGTTEYITTTSEDFICDTETPTVDPGTTTPEPEQELPGDGTTPAPCPICPTVPISPAEKCKQGCNVAPWAHEECDKYYSCIGDQFRLNNCAEGLHFNPSTLTCDFICNAGCVRNVPQITRHPDGILMFVPNTVNNKMSMVELIGHELTKDL